MTQFNPIRPFGRPRAFSLVEILIVVCILAILAAIVVPEFTTAADQSRENSLKMTLYRVRQQIELYTQEHHSQPPQLDQFEAQLTLASDEQGQTAARGTKGYPLGPYLQELPVNPYTNGRTVSAGDVGTSDWYYNPTTGEFHANDSEAHRAY